MRVSCRDLRYNGLAGDQQGMETWNAVAAPSSYSISFSRPPTSEYIDICRERDICMYTYSGFHLFFHSFIPYQQLARKDGHGTCHLRRWRKQGTGKQRRGRVGQGAFRTFRV